VAPEDAPALRQATLDAIAAQAPFNVEARFVRADGEIRILSTDARPRWTAEGAFAGYIGVNVDVTDARQAEGRQQLLINELNHRVKNTLATVQSLIHQTLRDKSSAEAQEALTNRIMGLSAAHDVLTRSNWESAALDEVVAGALKTFGSPSGRFIVEGPAVQLGPQNALSLSMVLHELATNALKYGALSTPIGRIHVQWNKPAGQGEALSLTWRESGGPPVSPPSRAGFGSRLIKRSLGGEMAGEVALSFPPEGAVCTMRFAPDDVAAASMPAVIA
jgi:two-component sensor histidine kinase